MSELRRCEELTESILELCCYYEQGNKVKRAVCDDLEAFAKQEQIKGMESVRKEVSRRLSVMDGQLEGCDGDDWIALNAKIRSNSGLNNWIDAEIAKLTEGKP